MSLIQSSNPIYVSSLDEYQSIKSKYFRRQFYRYNCCKCGKEEIARKDAKSLLSFLCKSCLRSNVVNSEEYKQHRIEKQVERYGSHEAYTEKWKASVESSNLQKYGCKNVFQVKEIKDKIKRTSLEKYGTSNPGASKEAREKQKQTMLERYGVEVFSQDKALYEKGKKTKQERYGNKNFNNREKSKQTCLEKYGVDNSFKCEAVRNKWQQNMLQKYGSTHPYFGHSFYKFDENIFDSSWELIFYCWLQLENKTFNYHSKRIPYFICGKKHFYEPDFEVNETLYEIKGPQFFNEAGHLINPWNGEVLLEKEQCMKDNNVVIVTDIKNYRKVVLDYFGKDFIDKCKLVRHTNG